MSERWRAQNFRAMARGYCLTLNRFLLRGVLPVELLTDACTCLEAASAITEEGVVLS